MTKLSSLEKRVKRRITAREHRFFAVCPPGVKNLCYREIAALTEKLKFIKNSSDDLTSEIEPAPFKDIEMILGGVEFTSLVQGCYAANLYLRSPSKILMRIAHFKAENFRTLEKKLKEIEWELYLKPLLPVHFEVSTKSSRLYHTDAVAQRAQQAVRSHFNRIDKTGFNELINNSELLLPNSFEQIQTIFIRAEDDLFEVSIDSSGELLHKRGVKKNVGFAPIRENLAFAVLSALDYTYSTCSLPLIDGMCGSGTFSLEAAMIANNIPAGFFRRFAFESWLCFRAGQWNYMKKAAQADISPAYKNGDNSSPFIFAFDKNDKILKELERAVEIFNFGSSIKIMQGDFFDIKPERLILEKNSLNRDSLAAISEKSLLLSDDIKGFVVLNPPYGKRIGDKSDSEKIFIDIGKKLKSDFKGWRGGVILPDRRLLHHLPGRKSLIPLFHGGLEIYAAVMQI